MPTASVPEPLAPRVFAPPLVEIPSADSKVEGDGAWQAWPDASGVSFRTVVHPHRTSRFVRMDIVAIDLGASELHWVLGSKDDEKGRGPDPSGFGLVPTERHEATLFVLNGGFQPRHGRWGIHGNGFTLQPMKPEGCVVAVSAAAPDARVRIAPWSAFDEPLDQFEFVRQTPPCLLHDGEISKPLLAGNDKAFAGNNPELRTRRRSALGIDVTGQVLYYALGTETEPIDLARGLRAVGARDALQLDINWNWARCLVPGRNDAGAVRIRGTLVEGMPYGTNEYFVRPSERDFFYVTRRDR